MNWKIGDRVTLKAPFWHEGENLGGCCGYVADVRSYVMVKVVGIDDPIKCFQYDLIPEDTSLIKEKDVDTWEKGFFKNIFQDNDDDYI